MASKRILLATELSRGAASLLRILPLAAELADRGHDVSLALPQGLGKQAEAAGFPVFDAPNWDVPPPPGFVAVSYADLLLTGGYATADALRNLVVSWQKLFDQARPDLLITDLAPTAMLTARMGGLAMAAIGDGYSLPPLTAPLPVLRPWADLSAHAAADIEGRMLAVINVVLPRPLRHLRDLFDGVPCFLCALPELDHYPGRTGADFYGQVFAPSRGPAPVWPVAEGRRVYVDLDPRHRALGPIAEALQSLGLVGLIQGACMAQVVRDRLVRPLVGVTTTGNRAAILSGCDFVVCQGVETAGPALLAGKPLLMLPVFTEQMMTLHRVATQGFGHGIEAGADAAAIQAALRRLADDRDTSLRAANFARLYDGYRPAVAINAIADEIDED